MAQQSAEKREDDPWDSWDVEEVDKRPESKEASPLKMASMAGSPVRKPADVTEDKYRSKKFVDVELDQGSFYNSPIFIKFADYQCKILLTRKAENLYALI
jgi:hypothetical protein